MRQLLEKIEENAKFIEKERAKISFGLHEDKMVAAWEASVRAKGTPLLTFFESWNKVNRIQKRKKITKNDEIAGALPMIKRPKIADTEEIVEKPENKGPLVLFPSDSEDDGNFKLEDDSEEPKPKKIRKKNKKKSQKKLPTPEIESVPDKEDVVQDFSVNDW